MRYRAEPWLQSPLRTPVGDIELAGLLRNATGIDPVGMRILRRFTLVLMVEGKGYYVDARGNRLDLNEGDAVLVFPEIAHAYGPLAGTEWTQIYVVFDGPQFELWRAHGLISAERPVLQLGSAEYWRQRLSDVIHSEPKHGVTAPIRVMGQFLRVFSDMLAADAENRAGAGNEAWLEKSLRLLGERSAQGWMTPQDVAHQVGLTYENFRKQFAHRTGESPGRYQKRRRIDWACAAIYHGEQSLKQIADELGFCDVFHFSKAFKQMVRQTPSEYRRRVYG